MNWLLGSLFARKDIRANFVSTDSAISGYGCVSFSLYVPTLIPSSALPCVHAALPALLLYYESVRLPTQHTVYSPLFGLSTASLGNRLALPGSNINSSVARHGLRPRHVSMLSPLRAFFSGFREMKPLAFVLHRLFRAQYLHLRCGWLPPSLRLYAVCYHSTHRV